MSRYDDEVHSIDIDTLTHFNSICSTKFGGEFLSRIEHLLSKVDLQWCRLHVDTAVIAIL